jgi:hypothetical protein
MLSDAVAVAGLRAAEGNHRRAVLLMLGPQREDVSRFPADVVRRFLADLHVPLVVWDLSGPGALAPASWRPDDAIDGFEDLAAAAGQLRTLLDRQRIVWLSGATCRSSSGSVRSEWDRDRALRGTDRGYRSGRRTETERAP